MPFFTPPTTEGVQIADPSRAGTEGAHALWHFYDTWAMGQTVWKDQLGVWHQTIYPYQGGQVDRVFRKGVLISEITDSAVTSLANAQVVYEGGHKHTITEAEATELTAAGFGAGVDLNHSLQPTVPFSSTGWYIDTPDSDDFIVGDQELDVRVYATGLTDWAPVFLSNWIIAKANGGAQNEWAMTFHALEPRFALYDSTGLRAFDKPREKSIGIPGGVPYGCRVVVQPKRSDGLTVGDYFISPDGGAWEHRLHAAELVSNYTGIQNGTHTLTMPGGNGGLPWFSHIYWAEVRIDGELVAHPDMRQLAAGTTEFTDSVGKVWTLHGPCSIG